MQINHQPDTLKQHFAAHFGNAEQTQVYFSPGRVNLIGEHIDYNGGYVFPAALTIGISAVLRKRNDLIVNLVSANKPDVKVSFSLESNLTYEEKDSWGNYPKGVFALLPQEGYKISQGFDILFYGDLPDGAGLSSSAAIEVLTTFAVLTASNYQDIDLVWLAKFCQKVENQFIQVNCGIMDQFSVALGKKEQAILLDCNSLEYNYVPIIMHDYKLVLMNTNKRRELADSKYNERRGECDTVLALVNKHSYFKDLCSVDRNYIDRYVWDETLYKRARHVILENQRVIKAVTLLQKHDLRGFGNLLIQSHQSLKNDYEVTGKELDTIVEEAVKHEGCLGARMTGAGFGGCAVALVKNDFLEDFKVRVAAAYTSRVGLTPAFYTSEIGNGVHRVA